MASSCREPPIDQGLYILTNCTSSPPSDGESSPVELPEAVDCTLVSVFICYNLGVVYSSPADVINHQQGHHDLRSSKAYMMFESCRQLLLNFCDRFVGSSASTVPALLATGIPLVDLLCLSTLAKLAEVSFRLLSKPGIACSFSHRTA
jgi:hypothetical protein